MSKPIIIGASITAAVGASWILARYAAQAVRDYCVDNIDEFQSEFSALDEIAAYQKIKGGLTRFQQEWVQKGKSKFPCLEFSEANWLMVLDWLSREMTEADVRTQWIMQCLPVIAAGIMVPSRAEIKARKMLKSIGTQRRVNEMEQAKSLTWVERILGVRPLSKE